MERVALTAAQKLNPTQRRLLNRAVKLKRLQWSCNGLCTDGRPHQYMPHPHARANQLVDSHPLTAFITGRGFGKTRAAAEWAKNRMSAEDGHRLAIVVPTFGYYRVTVEGESGMLALVPPSWGARWNVSKGELKFKNGSVAQVFGTDTQADAERLRGYQFHSLWAEELCVAYGSTVATARGDVPIQDVQVGDQVWTRQGLCAVSAARRTGFRETVTISTAHGELRCTPDHKVMVNGAWLNAGDARPNDSVTVWTRNLDRLPISSGRASDGPATLATATTATAPGFCSTAPYGLPSGERSPTATTFTTSMGTAATTRSTTSRPNRKGSTAASMPRAEPTMPGSRTCPVTLHAHGSRQCGPIERPRPSGAPVVARCTSPRGCAPGSAADGAVSSSVVLSVERSSACDVYDLTVEGAHEFFAGGHLVHNCEWRHQQLAWDMAMFGLRLGDRPQTVVTTTPKPTPVIRELLARAEAADPLLSLRTGSTYDNFDNLPPEFQARIRTYEGSPRGSAEIHGRMLEDVEGALWQRAMIHYGGAHDGVPRLGEFTRIVVAIDPAGTHNPKSDETGLVVCGLAGDGRVWVLADSSGRYSPNGWATRAIGLYEDFEADAIVAETNFGAEMVETTLRSIDRNIRFLEVKATRGAGKQARAEPVVDLYQRGMVIHEQLFVELEDQMCQWVPGESRTSPDRLDAMVWGVTELVLKEQKPRRQMRFHA